MDLVVRGKKLILLLRLHHAAQAGRREWSNRMCRWKLVNRNHVVNIPSSSPSG